MNELEALLSLNMVPEIGSTRLEGLLNFFGKPENIFKAPLEKLESISGIGSKIAFKLHSFNQASLKEELKLAREHNLKIVTYNDSYYPENLKQIPGYPIVLYIKGEIKKEDSIAIAVVGSRRATLYGLTSAWEFAGNLAASGVTIISGMARGIDTSAHKGALKRGGRTIAVIGSGFKHLYPSENKELAEDVAKQGAVISEFPINVEPLKQNFPRRNRIISGLSLGVVVVEAARNSGALITADFALEQGKEVFALPGKIDSSTSFGTNELIKQGAKLISSVEDILEELPFALSGPHLSLTHDKPQECVLPGQEGLIYNLLAKEPVALDEIVEKTNLSITSLSMLLLNLQIKKLVIQLPGKYYMRSGYGA